MPDMRAWNGLADPINEGFTNIWYAMKKLIIKAEKINIYLSAAAFCFLAVGGLMWSAVFAAIGVSLAVGSCVMCLITHIYKEMSWKSYLKS